MQHIPKQVGHDSLKCCKPDVEGTGHPQPACCLLLVYCVQGILPVAISASHFSVMSYFRACKCPTCDQLPIQVHFARGDVLGKFELLVLSCKLSQAA